MNSTDPVVSIIIPTLKEAEYLERTLRNFDAFTLPHEIILTDGGSTDGTLEIARRYTDKITIWDKPRRQTFGEAKNAGAALAKGKFLVFIDADVIIPEPNNFFAEIISYFDANPKVIGATVPLHVLPDQKQWGDVFFPGWLNTWYTVTNNWFNFGNASGEFQMIRTDAFRKAGGYDEHLRAGEDTIMFNKLSKIGHTRVYTKLEALHTCRRAHKLGWIKLYSMWMWQGLTVLLFKQTAFKEWKVIR
ncbi:MAG TPA: glycosyltransferase [Candidatus Paceibacterota bacterium]|nr:glycosyltransferase [Candidatus Paceibacterota bacterium]